MTARKRPSMSVMVRFDPPNNASFAEIRDFIVNELESSGGNRHPEDPLFHSLRNVYVSKPITVWRNPMIKQKSNIVPIVKK